MTKILGITAAVILGCAGFSAANAATTPNRPSVLKCTSPGRGAAPRDFTLSDFNTSKPQTDLDTASDSSIEDNGTVISFCGNNGCDNNYCFVFMSSDLSLMAQGKLTSTHGLMNFFNGDSKTTDAETVAIHCRVIKR
jgi:hypothetical protein